MSIWNDEKSAHEVCLRNIGKTVEIVLNAPAAEVEVQTGILFFAQNTPQIKVKKVEFRTFGIILVI